MEDLLDIKQLAQAMGRSRGYIYAMMASGFRMSHGSVSTQSSARQWLKDHPDFRSSGYFGKQRNGARGGKVEAATKPRGGSRAPKGRGDAALKEAV
jgi:predicted DNA-binding transcriptional regulator AlpA